MGWPPLMPKIAIPPFARRHVVNQITGEDLGEYSNASLGDAAGLGQFGVHLEILHPGGKSSMRHWHESEDEFVYVLDGELTLVEDEGATPLRAGDAAAWKAGVANARRLENRGSGRPCLPVVGTRAERDRAHYADHDLIVTFDGPRRIYAAATAPSSRRPEMPIFHTEVDADGVATIAWDLPGRSMNVLTEDGIAELDAAVDRVLADPAVKGAVITSAKSDFAGGMDLNVLAEMKARAGADPAAASSTASWPCTTCCGRSSAPAWTRRPEGRQADRLGGARPLGRHRHRDRPRLPPPLHGRQPEGPHRPARDPRRHLSRRRRRHPPRAHARPDGPRPTCSRARWSPPPPPRPQA